MARSIYIFSFLVIGAISHTLSAQDFEIKFEKVVHDFGMIAENDGLFGYSFRFLNGGEFPIRIDSAAVSCGCMIPQWNMEDIAPGDSGEVAIIYDPFGRPGEFTKSLTLFISGEGATTLRYLNVKGTVLEAETADAIREQYEAQENIVYDFQIKPFTLGFTSLESLNISTSGFNQFLNDITYIIDQDGFANIVLELEFYGSSLLARPTQQTVIDKAKLAISEGLERRGYEPYTLGITTLPINVTDEAPSICPVCMGILTIASDTYNNNFLDESVIVPLQDFAVMKDTTVLADSVFKAPGSFGFWHVEGVAEKFKFSKNKDQYTQFLRSALLLFLDFGALDVQVKLGDNQSGASYVELIAVADRLRSELIVALAEEGIEDSSLVFLPHRIQEFDITDSDTKDQYNFVQIALYPHTAPQDNVVEYVPEEPEPTADPVIELDHAKLPVYQLAFSGEGNKHIDTTSTDFITMMDSVIAAIGMGEHVKLLIESSASKTPTKEVWDNNYVSRERAGETEETIRSYMLAHGVSEDDIKFEESVCLVQGPEYRRDVYPIGFYKQFQYLRVIPFLEPESNSAKSGLLPYLINFGEAQTQINSFSPIFERFIKALTPVIKEQGYIKIILEASSSRIPTSESYPSNDILAFYRAQDAKEILLTALYVNGVDPNRVIITEQNALVQGPPYNENVDMDKTAFEKYQYIKIIPEALVKE